MNGHRRTGRGCHERSHAPQQTSALFDHFLGADEQVADAETGSGNDQRLVVIVIFVTVAATIVMFITATNGA
jgi:hypothetical protein